LLILPGKLPGKGKGKWSLPGGAIELGEETAIAARRRLMEECGLDHGSVRWACRPFTTTDAIYRDSEAQVQFHYREANSNAASKAGDDALDACCWTLDEVARGAADGSVAGNCDVVWKRPSSSGRQGSSRSALVALEEPSADEPSGA
jgi:8-oxo-dGTP pyrophosphatase MutT (NUDIX family)